MKKKILIIYASYGSGHKAIANYIADYFKEQDSNLEIATLDIVTYSMKVVGSISQKMSNFFMLRMPHVHGMFYNLVSTKIGGDFIDDISTTIFKNKRMEKMITSFNPDIIIATHFFGASLYHYYTKKNLINAKLITIITDYDIIEIWTKFHKDASYVVAGNTFLQKDLLKNGVDKKKIKCFGIPIAPKIENGFNKESSLKKYKFSGKKMICLFFGGGGNGSMATIPYIKKLALNNPWLDIIFVAGRNEKSKNIVDDFATNNSLTNVRTIGFATNVPELIELSDFVITKPGGIQLTECLYFGKGVLMIRHSGGQEIANYKFFESQGYGKYFKTSWGLNNFVMGIKDNPDIIKEFSKNMKKHSNSDSMSKLYDLVKDTLNS